MAEACWRCGGAEIDTYVDPTNPTGFTERPCPACKGSNIVWSGSQCPITPDSCWIDDTTGEHVNAYTNKRTKQHGVEDASEGN